MKYYIIMSDKEQPNQPMLINWYNKIDVRNLHPGNYGKIPDKTMIYVKHDKDLIFPKVVVHPFFLLDQDIRNIMDKYEPNMNYKIVFLVDKKNGNFKNYSLPLLGEFDCISDKSEFNQDKSVIHKLVLKKERLPFGVPVFVLKGLNTRCIIARMDFMESILRKEANGFILKSVEIE